MSARKILLWVLPVLSFAALIIPILIERAYQSDRQAGWITHLPTSDSSSCITSSGKILVDGQGNVWITGTGPCDTTYDIYVYNGESWTSMGTKRGVLLALDGQGRIWKLTEVKNEQNQVSTIEIAVFEVGNWSNFTTVLPQTLRKNFQSTNTLAIDGQGRVWLGFFWSSKTGNQGPGVSVYDGQKWTTYVPNNSGLVGDSSVLAMAIDRQHRAWISTDGGGLSVFDGQAWTNYTGENFDLPYTANITSIAFDGEGDAWLGTEHGDVIADEGDQWIEYRLDNCNLYPWRLQDQSLDSCSALFL